MKRTMTHLDTRKSMSQRFLDPLPTVTSYRASFPETDTLEANTQTNAQSSRSGCLRVDNNSFYYFLHYQADFLAFRVI